jgi:hypothetical protein
LQARAHPRLAAGMDHQTVGRDQKHLEKDEQVEDIARQEGAADSHELELEKRVEMPTSRVPSCRDRVDQHDQRKGRGQKHHQRRQPVEHQDNAERCGPVAQPVDVGRPIGGH